MQATVETQKTLSLVPVTLAEANLFVSRYHRHHKPVVGHKFSIGLSDGEAVRGVVITGRPVSRHQDNGTTLEVNRCCTDGVRNGCSMLYRAAWRVTQNLGYRRLITYTLDREPGASLRGAGFKLLGLTKGGQWGRDNRPRVEATESGQKQLWELAEARNDARKASDGLPHGTPRELPKSSAASIERAVKQQREQ